MNTPLAANLNMPDELIDHAYDVMSTELDHWQVIGPQRGKSIGGVEQEFYTAVRAPDQAGYAPIIMPGKEAEATEATYHHQNFKSKPYAIAYVQWNSLRAVLSDAQIQLGIMKLAEGSANGQCEVGATDHTDE